MTYRERKTERETEEQIERHHKRTKVRDQTYRHSNSQLPYKEEI